MSSTGTRGEIGVSSFFGCERKYGKLTNCQDQSLMSLGPPLIFSAVCLENHKFAAPVWRWQVDSQTPNIDTILLVHGTFSGPQTPFFRNPRPAIESLFPKAIIDTIKWDGGNYLESRYRAELALLRNIRTFKNQRVLIIAHSHVGNVAYRAVARYKPRTGVTIAGLCTIGTPFIELIVRDQDGGTGCFPDEGDSISFDVALVCRLCRPVRNCHHYWRFCGHQICWNPSAD
jgi:hypothetical protein